MKKLLFNLMVFSLFTRFTDAATVEEKLLQLENKIKELENRVEVLERGKAEAPYQQPVQKKTPLLKQGVEPIGYKLVEKKFKKIEDRLLERDEKIQFVFEITNNFSKQIDTIYGEIVIKDRKGEELVKKPIKIYKPMDFFSPGKIKPGETFRRTIEIIYDEQVKNLRYLKDAPLSDLNVELIFTKVEFSDGYVEMF